MTDVSTNINVGTAENGFIGANFYTEDDGSAYIRITIKDNNEVLDFNKTDMTPRLDLFSSDGSIFTNEPLEVVLPEHGVIQYKVSDNVIKHAGKVDAKLFLANKKDSVHVANFYFTITDSGMTGPIGKEVHVDSLQGLVKNVMKENAVSLMDDDFKSKLETDLQTYVTENSNLFKGEQGEQGVQGIQGPPGKVGEQGPRGIQGEKGKDGKDGVNGLDGKNGIDGKDGVDGANGEKGDPFTFDDFTQEQLKSLKGERGPEGVPGKDADMTEVNNLKKDDYYDITYEKFVDAKTNSEYYVTTIPHKDEEGNIIKLKRGFANDNFSDGVLETARSFSNKKNLSFVANASVFDMKTNVSLGVQINEGKIIQESSHSNNYTLGIKEDNTLTYYTSDIPAQKIIDDGCHIALTGFYPLIENGEKSDYNLYNVTENVQENHARQVIGQKENKDLVFITVQGKGIKGVGVTYNDLYDICVKNDIVTAYSLDGGGSAQTVVRGSLINLPLDNNGYEERKVSDFLYVDKKNNNNRNRSYNYDFGQITKRMADLTADSLKNANIPKITTISVDLNNIKENGIYWATRETLNSPGEITYSILHFQMGQGNAIQLAIPYHVKSYEILIRRTISGMNSWSEWRTNEYSTEWLSLELLNGWKNYGGNDTVAECKIKGGVVYIRGLISGGLKDSGTTLFTLPEGLRPSKREYISTISKGDSGNVLTRIIIETSGTARLLEGSSNWLILNYNFAI